MKNNLHPLQSPRWAEFRKKTGVKVVVGDSFIVTIHKIPYTPFNIGYFPKGPQITEEMIEELKTVGKKEKCIFIQLEPNVEKDNKKYNFKDLVSSEHPLFTKFTFILDLTKSEDELLKNMHPKTRYNIRIAEKKGVKVLEDKSDKAFEEYLKLSEETTKRQKFYAHTKSYHRLMWETLKQNSSKFNSEILSAHLLKAVYKDETLVSWILFTLGDTLYYPYGASSSKHREVMASNLMMWEAIKFGKKLGLKKFDMWGSLGTNPDPKDSWFGFHRFKEGYGGRLTEFVGSYDLIINKNLYYLYKLTSKARWAILRFI